MPVLSFTPDQRRAASPRFIRLTRAPPRLPRLDLVQRQVAEIVGADLVERPRLRDDAVAIAVGGGVSAAASVSVTRCQHTRTRYSVVSHEALAVLSECYD